MSILETKIDTGSIRGMYAADHRMTVFRGIPFAAPPVGKFRFKGPQPAASWEGVLDCREFKSSPMQRIPEKNSFYGKENYPVPLSMSEDCLYINVTTPAASAEERLPVAVYVYGGGFHSGSSSDWEIDGEALAKRGLVFVSFNYRVGIFGYFTHPWLTEESGLGTSGNYGFQDQIAAIDWIRRNITAFGGDPDCISIFGQSAGSVSAQMMTSTPFTVGKIRRAIFQSGGGIGGPAGPGELLYDDLQTAEKNGEKFCHVFGISSLEELRALPEKNLLEICLEYENGRRNHRFKPCVDGYYLPEPLYKAALNGRSQNIDYMVGCTSNEGAPFITPKMTADHSEAVKRIWIRYHDYADEVIKQTRADTAEGAAEFLTRNVCDMIQSAAYNWGTCRAEMGMAPSYLYIFARDIPDNDYPGAFHGAELRYVFGTLNRSWRHYKGVDYELSEQMTDYWANFFKTGDPNGKGLPRWENSGVDGKDCMILDVESHMDKFPENPVLLAERRFIEKYR